MLHQIIINITTKIQSRRTEVWIISFPVPTLLICLATAPERDSSTSFFMLSNSPRVLGLFNFENIYEDKTPKSAPNTPLPGGETPTN